MFDVLLFFAVILLSFFLTGLSCRYALQGRLMDNPNVRSSHSVPTPRGGGIAIVLSFLLSLIVLYYLEEISLSFFLAFSVGGGLVAAIGFMDDHHPVKARWRIVVHFAAAGLGLYLLSDVFWVKSAGFASDPTWIGFLLGVVSLVWFLNLFNFMDGIDGLATTEAIFIAGGGAFITVLTGQEHDIWSCLLIVASSFGFLVWNWPPARIFLGDVGSGFLGIMLGYLAVYSISSGQLPLWTWIVLSGVFLVDATVTLVTRIVMKKRWYEAHRDHAYQHLSQRLKSHKKVTLAVLLINTCWLFPLGWLAARRPGLGWIFTVIALVPLVCIVLKLNAGREMTTVSNKGTH